MNNSEHNDTANEDTGVKGIHQGQILFLAFLILIIGISLMMAGVNKSAGTSEDTGTGGSSAYVNDEKAEKSEAESDFTAQYFDPRTKPVKPGPKTFEMVMTERKVEVDGEVFDMWTFEDTVPGPVQRVVVGDEVTIRIHNAGDSLLMHSVDYHSSRLTLGGGHVQVAPGETGEFSFVAEYPGVFMYHCATPPVHQHIGMGMYGMMIVQPEEGFGDPMPEFAITQSELYANIKDIETKDPAKVVFNGIPNQYINNPINLPSDSNVRLFVLNAGPSELSSFHIVGTVFDRVLEDGNPFNETRGRQALAMPASGGGVFEMKLVGDGQFPIVTHQFNHVAMGAVGMIITGDGGLEDGEDVMPH